jgi:CotH kinase protein
MLALELLSAIVLLTAPVTDVTIAHGPQQPKPDAAVVVTAKLPVGTKSATLKIQAVAPGKYIRKADAEYEKTWTELTMTDDGKNGDAKAGDGIFTTTVPKETQKHRTLIRYRVVAVNEAGAKVQHPAADAECPNFAYWCDAGAAEWSGAQVPGKTTKNTYTSAFLNTMPTMHLLAKADDVAKSQWDGNHYKEKFQGTVVYRGEVYDHVQFNNRGQGSTYASGKNKWGVKFLDSKKIKLIDQDGVAWPHDCDSLNLNPGGSTPHLPIHRGITGLDEVLSMKAYRLAGVPAPSVMWMQWRVVTGAEEMNAKDQYVGDLWGLYVVVAEMEPKQLSATGLPDGLTVSAQSGLKHTPKTMMAADKTWEGFINSVRSNPKETWWTENLDLKAYSGFHAMNRLLGNVDLRPDGNHGYYRAPDGHWSPIPWDNDMMFVPRHHQPGYIDAIACLNHEKFQIEYRNRARDILDLYVADRSPTGGQLAQQIADMTKAIQPKDYKVDWAMLDAAVWDQNPHMNQKGSYFVKTATGDHFGGRWSRTLATNDFDGFRKYILDFCTDSRKSHKYAPNDGDPVGYGWGYLNHEAKDDKIPAKPTVTKKAEGQHEASEFVSPVKQKAEALEWRVGRVGQPGWYELSDHWTTTVKTGKDVMIPKEVFKDAGTYRVRARWKDATGRCSHWSEPVEVVVPKK